MEPSLRKPFGMFGLIIYIALYALIVAALFEPITKLHVLIQTPVWLVLGIAWVLPLKPFLRWMETGKWR